MDNLLQMAWPFILMGVIFYVMIYRPQKRDQKKRSEMLDSLKVGTNIVTIGGILGTITKVQEDKVRIKVAEGVEFHIRKSAVGGVITSAFTKKESKKETPVQPEAKPAEAPAEGAAQAEGNGEEK
ncbi:preprotein translocase subunit YajC [Acidaminococcus fermentans]|uniref:Preprotein translocase subunit YajC n=1 Tax=Acidaminococcus fermentans TaxID=905 RepID=A0A6N7W396_ACIFE|nr:preprotein translocase subunit YajC [Acidaminococcus fermentans]MEE1598535.1 preprotein translocase subunit YajC [Acidaminococcus fermentans]MEE4122797.1 preprotein translocase subunit YajC [Acidaminococcus fermentans]MSS82608.1 preprotein translocase subunit YajC [Acidaminococcus fermentans]